MSVCSIQKLNFSFLQLAIICCYGAPCLAEGPSWRQDNDAAIKAMREDKFNESELLFHKALDECKLDEDRKTVKGNLAILLQKLGRHAEAKELQGKISVTSTTGSTASHDSPDTSSLAASNTSKQSTAPANSAGDQAKSSKNSSYKELVPHLKQLDDQIKAADAAGDLEALQALFQKKAEAVRVRDRGESLDYAYTLHFRAQVLRHMHKDAQADALESYATKVRDAARMQAQQQHAMLQQQQLMQQQQTHHRQSQQFQTVPFTWNQSGSINVPPSRLSQFDVDFDPGSTVNLPNLNQTFTNGSQSTYLPDSYKNAIDRNTTPLRSTPSATSTLNAERNFGK